MISQALPTKPYHYDCAGCLACSEGAPLDSKKYYPYFYVDGVTYCPNCYPQHMKYAKEVDEQRNCAVVQE